MFKWLENAIAARQSLIGITSGWQTLSRTSAHSHMLDYASLQFIWYWHFGVALVRFSATAYSKTRLAMPNCHWLMSTRLGAESGWRWTPRVVYSSAKQLIFRMHSNGNWRAATHTITGSVYSTLRFRPTPNEWWMVTRNRCLACQLHIIQRIMILWRARTVWFVRRCPFGGPISTSVHLSKYIFFCIR